jgi:hypothetical protein
VPEQQDQDDDRDRHPEQPEQDSATHRALLSGQISWMKIADGSNLVPSAAAIQIAGKVWPSSIARLDDVLVCPML